MFHPNQVLAASRIHSSFLSGTRCALLSAKCQSGKTGTFQSLIRQMLESPTDGISRAYIICGSAETELKRQAVADTLSFNAEWKDSIEVIFHQDFKHAELDIQDALIVVDESHMVQTKKQQLHLFLAKHGVFLDGNPAVLTEKNAFLLSVDATPYSEIAALREDETPFPKHVETLTAGDGYYGLAEYERDGLLKPTFPIFKAPERFETLLQDVGPKYVLLRMNRSKANKENETELRHICRKHGFDVLLYTGEQTQIAVTRAEQKRFARSGRMIGCLEDAPAVTTVVIVRGRLRAGKVVPKTHVGFVWEGANKSKTDVLVQGLVGRMCGYAFGEKKPTLYVPVTALVPDELGQVLCGDLPKTATNLRASATTNGKSVFSA
ncbi:MAG: hypothetical protein EBT28_00905 [Betaproteobacteria bacterium]|nr:hypothetical protein [Betaproteobacteria bacterium]